MFSPCPKFLGLAGAAPLRAVKGKRNGIAAQRGRVDSTMAMSPSRGAEVARERVKEGGQAFGAVRSSPEAGKFC